MFTVRVYDRERRARTVAAIKFVREVRGLGLAESLNLINEVYYHYRPVELAFASKPEADAFAQHMESMGFRCRFVVAGESSEGA